MAFSMSLAKDQDIAKCYLCETETNLKWRCVECDFLMCNNCQEKIHSKFKYAQTHKIIDIKDIGKNDFT